jgi:hypothetical protein
VTSIKDISLDRAARLYLSASYLYYWRNVSLMADEVFDHLCERLVREYESLSEERKSTISLDDLTAGTCLKPMNSFSRYVVEASEFWIDWKDKITFTR